MKAVRSERFSCGFRAKGAGLLLALFGSRMGDPLKPLLMLAEAPGRLLDVERFLKKRGWDLKMHSDLKSFLVDVTRLNPTHALISIDFKHANLAQIRPLLEKVYRLILIDFAEDQTLQAWTRLKALESPNKIYGVLTGHAFERTLARAALNAEPTLEREGGDVQMGLGLKQILDSVFNVSDGVIKKNLTWVSRLHCIEVDAPGLRGQFVIALANDRVLDQGLADKLSSALLKLLQGLGFEVEALDHYGVETRKVEFAPWSAQTASFVEKSVHAGVEIGMAFIPSAEELPKLMVAVSSEMLELSLDEIRPDEPLSFDVFLHLPLNGKFILYVSQSGQMSLSQQINLQSRGISKVYAKNGDERRVRQYRTTRRLDQSIASYYENRDFRAA